MLVDTLWDIVPEEVTFYQTLLQTINLYYK